MRLTTFTDYSLRVLMYLATQPDRQATVAEIATAFAISESHLTKVVHHLGRRGLLKNARGRGGGIELARPASSIRLGVVISATEGQGTLVECFNPRTNRCVITPICGVRIVLAQALEGFYAALDRYTLADITRNRAKLRSTLGTV